MSDGEEDNLTIVSSWAPRAYQCFAEEFEELEQLREQHEETRGHAQQDLEARCRAEVDLQIQKDYPEVYPLLATVAPSPRAGAGATAAQASTPAVSISSGNGGSASKRPKNKQAQQQLQAELAMVTAKRDALLQQHIQAALVAQDRQPARQLAMRYTAQLAATQKSVKMYLEKEAHELQRFTSRPLASYALGEVLDAPPTAKSAAVQLAPSPPPQQKSAAASPKKRDAAASVSRAASERGSVRSSRQKKPVQSQTATRSGKSTGGDSSSAAPRSRTHSLGGRKGDAVVVDFADKSTRGAADAVRPPPFLIDAHQFAVEYNEMLKKEYGYRPAMTNSFPTAPENANKTATANATASPAGDGKSDAQSSSPSANTEEALQAMLRTHMPGITAKRAVQVDSARSAEYSGKGWLPPISAAMQQNFAASASPYDVSRNADGTEAAAAGRQQEENGFEDKEGDSRQQRFAHSSPAPQRRGKDAMGGSKKGEPQRSTGAATKSSVAGAGTKVTASASAIASTKMLSGIDCAAKSSGVRFATHVGQPTSQTLRFVNRNAFRTRLRLKASTHPWLTFRCTRISPAAGSATASSVDVVPAETPLNCGGFVEVEVTFCPGSIDEATAVVEVVLEMGVARELNDRSSEGAQWQFMQIPVHGQVILPRFEWWRRTEADVAEDESETDPRQRTDKRGERLGSTAPLASTPALVSHDALTTCATPLSLGNGGTAVEFGDALVLASLRQTLFLENTGSAAVVHVLSSSPEFVVSVAPDVATELPPSQALALQVTFCPLKEGPCDATLTVAVRASSDPRSAVLFEHVVDLHGSGVVPRVSISSLASQVVQQSGVPQWQVSKSEAPLHTILADTMPGVPTEVAVTVCNDCAVPLAFHWEGDSDVPRFDAGAVTEEEGQEDADSQTASVLSSTKVATLTAKSFISPSNGTLPPFSTSVFTLTVTPATLQPLQTLYNLYLDEMPDPTAPENADKHAFVDAEVVEFYRRSRPVPCTVRQQDTPSSSKSALAQLPAACDDVMQVTYLDPVTAFSRFQRPAAGSKDETAEASDAALSGAGRGVFATSFLTYQQPSMPSLTITPSVVEEHVECLLRCRQTRTVTLQNNASVALHFVLDPTVAEFTQSLQQPLFVANLASGSDAATALTPTAATFERWRSFFPASDGIAVQCQPRKGLIPAHGSIAVAVHFTAEACGPHYAVVPCWIPEVEQLRALLATAGPALRTAPTSRRPSLSRPTSLSGRAMANSRRQPASPLPTSHTTPEEASLGQRRHSERRQLAGSSVGGQANTLTTLSRSPAEDALRIIEEGGCYAINVTATGVGATVKASTDLLDFGLIELGQEAAASFTVSNPNSIPVVFDLCDPLMRHPPRFVFIPESFRLGADNTVEVTVYRKAVSTEDAQTFFELTVRDGGASVAVETRATIQQPLLVVDTPTVHFGVVPEGVWQTGTFHISNRSAIDTEFTIAPATPPPPYLEMEYQQDYLLRAGEELDVPVRCRFQACEAGARATFRHPHASAPSPEQIAESCYSTLLGLVSKRSRQTLLVEVRCDAVEKLSVSVDVAAAAAAAPPAMPLAAYLRAVLLNALEARLATCAGDLEETATSTTRADTTAAPGDVHGLFGIAAPAAAQVVPLCSPAHLVDFMPDDLPLSRCAVDLVLTSYTGGEARYTLAAQRYAPQAMESTGAQGILDKKKAAAAAKSALRGKPGDGDDDAFALTSGADGDDAAVTLPAFWTATVNGGATAQQAQRLVVESAQKVLGDGSGCATLLSAIAGVLRSHGTVRIPVNLWCALPGRYTEHLCVRADPTLPLLRIPLDYEVYGKPVVLDATTSGLTKDGGREGEDVLLMPPVIAPLGTSRRTIRLVNRVSRDLDVTVDVFPCPLGMTVHAIDPDVPADEVQLKLLTMTEEDKDREGERVGRVTATPIKLFIPALSRREVILEFTPNAGLTETKEVGKEGGSGVGGSNTGTTSSTAASKKKAKAKKSGGNARVSASSTTLTGGANRSRRSSDSDDDDIIGSGGEGDGDDEAMLPPTEKWWQGSVCINAVMAQSESNDVFLVDEFYTMHAERYPSQRIARPLTAAPVNGKESGNSSTLSVTQIKVMRPLRSRPHDRVVRRGRIVWPTEAEQKILDRHAASQAGLAGTARAASAPGSAAGRRDKNAVVATASSSDDDSGDSVVDASSFSPPSQSRNGADGVIAAAVPSVEALLREAEERQALLDFIDSRRRTLQAESRKYFTSIELRLRARCGRPHLTIEPSEKCAVFPPVPQTESGGGAATAASTSAPHSCTRTVRLTNRNCAPLRFALSFAALQGDRAAATAAAAASPLFAIVDCAQWRSGRDESASVFSAAEKGGAGETGAAHVYVLDSMDALDVKLEALTHSAAWHRHLTAHVQDSPTGAGCVDGMLKIQFLPTTAAAAASATKSSHILRESEAPVQWLPLRVPLTKPSVECRPGVVWFRPGQQRHDGRPQVAYTQTFTLYNTSPASARFCIRPVATGVAGSLRGEAMNTFRAQQQQQLQLSTMTATVAPAVTTSLVAANTLTTQVGVAAGVAHRSLTHKVEKVVAMPPTAPPAEGRPNLVYVDDPAQFTLSPSVGVLPAASRGGEPGEVKVRVDFREFSDVRYESLFEVVVDGDASIPPTYVVIRGDSRDTEV